MADVLVQSPPVAVGAGHARWVRISHWILALAMFTLAVSGVFILMVHPRLYWGNVGNDLMPALVELPISRNYKHAGWKDLTAFYPGTNSPVTASRTYDIFNQNGWARSLHFLSAWLLVVPGALYLFNGTVRGHFRAHIWPRLRELSPPLVWRDIVAHVQMRIPPATGGPQYNLLQKCAYCVVIFVAAPLAAITGLTMSPAVTAAWPVLLDAFGGYQSARTIHFITFAALVLFVLAHVVMVVASGFSRQIRAMTLGE